jgi:hypothetical protein
VLRFVRHTGNVNPGTRTGAQEHGRVAASELEVEFGFKSGR